LNKDRFVDIDQLERLVGSPENVAVGQRIAEEAITLVRDNGQVLPLRAAANLVGTPGTEKVPLPYQSVTEARNRLVAVIFSDDMRTESGRVLAREILARVPDARIIYVDSRSAAGMRAVIAPAVEAAEHVIVGVYVVPTAGKAIQSGAELKNTVAMDEASASLLNAILDRAAARAVVLAMGNPYVIEEFPAIQNYVCAFSNATVSETAAVKVLFGEIPIGGHLPVTIPGIANRGDGLERPARAASGGSYVQN
jgi:beta-N-acetylhexosaminidase